MLSSYFPSVSIFLAILLSYAWLVWEGWRNYWILRFVVRVLPSCIVEFIRTEDSWWRTHSHVIGWSDWNSRVITVALIVKVSRFLVRINELLLIGSYFQSIGNKVALSLISRCLLKYLMVQVCPLKVIQLLPLKQPSVYNDLITVRPINYWLSTLNITSHVPWKTFWRSSHSIGS